MRTVLLPTACGLLAMSVVVLAGCKKKAAPVPASGQSAAHSHHHHHHHGNSRGPHGGRIIALDIDAYHGELTHDDKANRVGIYMLGEDTATPAPIDAKSVTIIAMADDKPTQFTLAAVPQPGDPAGKSSYFELVSEPLLAMVTGKLHPSIKDAQLSVTIDGKPHTGEIDTEPEHEHAASHSHGEDDALVWQKEVNDQGYKISLGHHGVQLLAGQKVEPAAQITREDKPVADAKVFNALLEANGNKVLSEEVAAVYEPPTGDEPSHYAQGALKIPPGTREAVIRFRIVLPEGKGEKTYDVPVAVK
jgi:hypothetical protein